MKIESPEDLILARRAHMLEPTEFPEAGCPDPDGLEDWLRDRDRIWERASAVLDKLDAIRAEEMFPAWFGSKWHQLLRHPWATHLEWAVEEAEKTVG
jgi:hypothetical protein